MFNERIKSERKRLKLSQAEFAKECGVSLRSQCNYEKGKRTPDSDYLQKAHKLGVDTNYLITGEPTRNAVNTDEAFLLQKFRNLSEQQRELMLKFVVAGFESVNNQSVINSPNTNIENSFNN